MKPADDSFDLPRLSETDPLLEELSLLKAQLPDASELASLASRLQLQGFDVAPAPSAPALKAAPWPKWLLGAGGGMAVGLGLWALGQSRPAPLAPDSSAPTAISARPLASINAAPGTPTEAERHRAVTGTTIASPNAPVEAALPAVTASAVASSVPTPSDSPSVAPSLAPPLTPAAPTRDTPARAATDLPRGSAPGASIASGSSPVDSSVPTELELLRDARLALKASPAAALELTERHARSYPGGKLAQERELIAVSALVALGRRTAAMGRAARFEQAFPGSPYRKQIAELLR